MNSSVKKSTRLKRLRLGGLVASAGISAMLMLLLESDRQSELRSAACMARSMTLPAGRAPASVPCPSSVKPVLDPSSLLPSRLAEAIAKLHPGKSPPAHLIDAVFIFDIRKLPPAPKVESPTASLSKDYGLAISASGYAPYCDYSPGGKAGKASAAAVPWGSGTADKEGCAADPEDHGRIRDVNSKMYWIFATWTKSTSEEFFKSVEDSAKDWDFKTKLLMLSVACDKAYEGYDHDWPLVDPGVEDVYQNMKSGGKKGGVCRSIHRFCAELAKRMGMVDVGLHSGVDQPVGSNGSAHVISHFKDPATGNYWVQNYGVLINTGEKVLTNAIDVSTRFLGPMSGASHVESAPGKVHLYQPRTSRWIKQVIEGQAEFKEGAPMVNFKLTPFETTVGVDIFSKTGENSAIKGFGVHSNYKTAEGSFSVTGIGVAGQTSKRYKLEAKLLDEVGYAMGGYMGALRMTAPVLSPDPAKAGMSDSRTNLFMGGFVRGTARISNVTGRLELKANALDVGKLWAERGPDASLPWHSITAALSYAPKDSPVAAEIARQLELGPTNWTKITPKLRSSFDKISIVVDSSKINKKVYVVAKGEVYLMGGFEAMDAVGIKASLKAAINSEELGEFYVVEELSGIVANPSKDPFYESEKSITIKAGYNKIVVPGVSVGGSLAATKGRPYFLFEEPGAVTPDGGKRDKPFVQGQVWTRVEW